MTTEQPLEYQRLYPQAADQILELIRAGDYPRGAKLPAERDLARFCDVTKMPAQ